jgi:DNA-binding NtrC family response regulator
MNTGGPRLLLVDDDVDICRNLSDILSDLGYRVECAHSGPAALDLARRSPFDLALLDLRMPGMDGITLHRELKRIRPGTVALLVTAYAGAETTAEALAAGAWQVVAKPVDFPRLLGLVDEAINQPLVLVVDDDRDLCASLWDLLRERGYRVSLAHDVDEAALRLKEAVHKVVLIDMKIPGGNGIDVYTTVREANPEARTVLITGHRPEMEVLVEQILAEGADDVCYKPFDVPQLLDLLERLTSNEGTGETGHSKPRARGSRSRHGKEEI